MGFMKRDAFGFEEITYLLLFGKLPDETQLKEFKEILSQSMTLPKNFTRDVILKASIERHYEHVEQRAF